MISDQESANFPQLRPDEQSAPKFDGFYDMITSSCLLTGASSRNYEERNDVITSYGAFSSRYIRFPPRPHRSITQERSVRTPEYDVQYYVPSYEK